MANEKIMGILKGEVSFGDFYCQYAILEGSNTDVALIEENPSIWQTYKGKRVLIEQDSLYYPDPDIAQYGTKNYTFPDENTDVAAFLPALEELLKEVDVEAKYSVLDQYGEDAFLYGISTFSVDEDTVFLIRLNKYVSEEESKNHFAKWVSTPYTSFAKCFRAGKGGDIRHSEEYIHHYANDFVLTYNKFFIDDSKKEEFKQLLSENKVLKRIDDGLGQALTNPLYMESLCKTIEGKLSFKFGGDAIQLP